MTAEISQAESQVPLLQQGIDTETAFQLVREAQSPREIRGIKPGFFGYIIRLPIPGEEKAALANQFMNVAERRLAELSLLTSVEVLTQPLSILSD